MHDILAKHPGIRPGDLKIEVLETSALEDLSRMSQVIKECRELGISFALDDFGTGYSSLTYLKRLAVSELKIDQSFVRDMLDDPEDLAILEGVIGLANAFRREVIAEGVETIEIGEMLLQLGCELAQGYGIARPMPADQMPNWAMTWRAPEGWSNCPKIHYEDLPLLHAIVEHRAWVVELTDYIEGRKMAPPTMDHHQCRFGVLMDSMLKNRPASLTRLHCIEPLHRQVHNLAAELCELSASGHIEKAKAGIDELLNLRDLLINQLRQLLVLK